MRINSHSNKPLNEIVLRLYSTDTKCSRKFIPFSPDYGGMIEFDRNAYACIEFQDSREIDMLIGMLERFRDKNIEHFGAWDM